MLPEKPKRKTLSLTKKRTKPITIKYKLPPVVKVPKDGDQVIWKLLQASPCITGGLPMAVGFFEQVWAQLPKEASRKQLRRYLRTYARAPDYQLQLIAGGTRYNFDGSEAGEIDSGAKRPAMERLRKEEACVNGG